MTVTLKYFFNVFLKFFRTLKQDEKTFAVGLQLVFVRLGYILGPTIYGFLIDKTCILWTPGECQNSRGFCIEYDNKRMRFFNLNIYFYF